MDVLIDASNQEKYVMCLTNWGNIVCLTQSEYFNSPYIAKYICDIMAFTKVQAKEIFEEEYPEELI